MSKPPKSEAYEASRPTPEVGAPVLLTYLQGQSSRTVPGRIVKVHTDGPKAGRADVEAELVKGRRHVVTFVKFAGDVRFRAHGFVAPYWNSAPESSDAAAERAEVREELEQLTVAELRDLAREHGVPVNIARLAKGEIVDRLLAIGIVPAEEDGEDEDGEDEPDRETH